jgi:hypothetical protein
VGKRTGKRATVNNPNDGNNALHPLSGRPHFFKESPRAVNFLHLAN